MLRYQLLQLAKLTGVLLFAGGAVAAFVATGREARRIAVHRVGSPGLLLIWIAGYLLATTLGWSIGQLWIVGGFATSIALQVVLAWSVARDDRRTRGAAAIVALLFVLTLVLMIWKPTWQIVR